MSYVYRTATAGDWQGIAKLLSDAFNDTLDEATAEAEGRTLEPERSVVAVRDGVIAGHASSFTRDMGVPGGMVAAAHVTMVSVDATHRRQGLLTSMITRLHRDAIDRREPIAVLWASEGRIYQRYGYGLAARKLWLGGRSSDIAWLDPAPPSGRLRAVPADSPDAFGPLYGEVIAARPGWSSRDERWWEYVLSDPPSQRHGATGLRAVVHEDDGGRVDGYLIWRVKSNWDGTGPDGTVQIRELVAANTVAYRSLWRFALSVDLTRNFEYGFAAVDEPLQYMIGDPRRLGARMSDALWVRVIDVPSALEARRYAVPVDVVLDVADDRIPANGGRWHLTGALDKAACVATDAPADLAIDVGALGSAYLGGTSLATLAAAGRVTELRPGTLGPAAAGFRWICEPGGIEVF